MQQLEHEPSIDLTDGAASTHTFTFLGTSSGCGVPAFFCECPACQEAREYPELTRTCCSALVSGQANMLIDTPPDLRLQLVRERIDHIDAVTYTHSHFDHFASLGELEYVVRLHTKQRIPVYCGSEAYDEIATMFGYMKHCLDRYRVDPFYEFTFDGVRYQAVPATHSLGTYGWKLTFPSGRTMVYMCDTSTLAPESAEAVRGVDVLAWDGTCWGKNLAPGTHHSAQEAVDEALELEVGQVVLTHVAPHFTDTPATRADMDAFCAPYQGRVLVAFDGMQLRF